MKEIKDIAQALSSGDIERAYDLKRRANLDLIAECEVEEIVRQAIISYLKNGSVYKARDAERLFGLEKETVEDMVKQAVLSSFRDGDFKTVTELRDTLPIRDAIARDIIDYCATWGSADYLSLATSIFN